MHVCIVTPFFYPLLNGVSVRVYKDAKVIQSAGHKVSIISPHQGVEDIDCYQVGRPPVYLNPMVANKIYAIDKKEKINIIISHSYISDLFSYLPARKIKAKFIQQIHGPEIEEIKKTSNGIKKLIGFIGCTIDKFIFKKSDKIIIVENELSDWLQKKLHINKEKIEFIANYPDLNIFKPKQETNEKFTIGYLGTLQPGRIKPLLFLSTELPNTKFIVVGDGDGKEEIKKYSNIQLFTEKNYFNIPSIINKFDVGIIFSLLPQGMAGKGPPTKLFEYLACEVPVIAVNMPELNYLIKKNNIGIIVHENNLVKGINEIRKNFSTYKQNVKSFRAKMAYSHNWQQESKKLLKLIQLI